MLSWIVCGYNLCDFAFDIFVAASAFYEFVLYCFQLILVPSHFRISLFGFADQAIKVSKPLSPFFLFDVDKALLLGLLIGPHRFGVSLLQKRYFGVHYRSTSMPHEYGH